MSTPADLHRATEAAFNAADVDALVGLYEPGAVLVNPDGSTAVGHEEIRAVWSGLLQLGGTMAMTTVHAVESGEIALLRNDFTITFDGGEVAGATAEVARRQGDGSWRYVVDHPFGAAPR